MKERDKIFDLVLQEQRHWFPIKGKKKCRDGGITYYREDFILVSDIKKLQKLSNKT